MIYNSLRGGALEKAGLFFEAGGENQTRDPADFLEFLDGVYLDTTRVSQANIELQNLKMKENERWADFFASWSNKLTEARGNFWADENKIISMLENAISKRLTQAPAGNHLLLDNVFSQWVQIMSKIAMRVERAHRKLGWPPGPSNHGLAKSNGILKEGLSESVPRATSNYQQNFRETTKPVARAEQPREIDTAGDTIMGGIYATNMGENMRARAKWKTQADIDRLREEERCFRCERRNCSRNKYPLLPGRRPQGSNIRVNAAGITEIDPSLHTAEGNVFQDGVQEN
ncbi:hypothetical protein K3495_g10487 [Podosphaera aphanis]|nr:hypothetical protein K3495_g10487 [Podosphaera aphanis]